ncbi:MAG: Sec-independent protein translocase protein TatB [Pseudomonadota bacterium]
MSGVGFSEFLILLVIGLIVLGPKRLPQVASQVGNWIGQARRMTRVMKRQLEDELDLDKQLNIGGSLSSSTPPSSHPPPRDDDTFSPMHSEASDAIDLDTDGSVDDERDEFDVEPDFEPADIAGEVDANADKKAGQ